MRDLWLYLTSSSRSKTFLILTIICLSIGGFALGCNDPDLPIQVTRDGKRQKIDDTSMTGTWQDARLCASADPEPLYVDDEWSVCVYIALAEQELKQVKAGDILTIESTTHFELSDQPSMLPYGTTHQPTENQSDLIESLAIYRYCECDSPTEFDQTYTGSLEILSVDGENMAAYIEIETNGAGLSRNDDMVPWKFKMDVELPIDYDI